MEIERIKESGDELNKDVWFSALQLKGNVQEKLGRKVAAVESYGRILDEFEGKRPLGSVRFKTGKILFDMGNVKGAERVWNGLDPQKNAMYVQLANEKLSNAKWEDDYKRYLNRIPAATDLNRSRQ